MIAFVCHPYHRGGVTSWMMDAFLEMQHKEPTGFITVNPKVRFFGGERPLMHELIKQKNNGKDVFTQDVGVGFELGTIVNRALVYAQLIRKNIPKGAALITSDDEACWMACAILANEYRMVAVLHADDDHYFAMLKKYMKYISGFVSVSKRVRERALKQTLQYDIPNVVIPCGIELAGFKHASVKQPIIVWIGRMEERQKRVSDIPKIAKILKEQGTQFSLLVFGHGSEMGMVNEKILEYQLQDEVKLMGWRSKEEIGETLANAKVLLQTSNFEGMSVAVMESLASGCMIVSTRVSGAEDLENEPLAKNVVKLYDIGDVNRGAQLLKECLENEDGALVGQAVQVAHEFYSIEGCMDNYSKFCNTLKPVSEKFIISSPVVQRGKAVVLGNIRYLKWKVRH